MKTLQQSHDEMAQQLVGLVSQLVYGHHLPTRMQLLMALGAVRDAVPHLESRDGGPPMPTIAYVDDLTTQVKPKP